LPTKPFRGQTKLLFIHYLAKPWTTRPREQSCFASPSVASCTDPVLKIMDAGYCLYVHIFVFFLSHLNRLIIQL